MDGQLVKPAKMQGMLRKRSWPSINPQFRVRNRSASPDYYYYYYYHYYYYYYLIFFQLGQVLFGS